MDFTNCKGKHIVRIESDSVEIKKLSDVDENWEINTSCPSCECHLIFNRNTVNKKITCNCGQEIFIQVDSTLL